LAKSDYGSMRMRKIMLGLILAILPSMLIGVEEQQVSATSWRNKANTPFFVTAAKDDELAVEAKKTVERYLSENSYRYKTEKDGTVFIMEISKASGKDKTEIKIYDPSTGEGIVPANEDNNGRGTIKKFAEIMKLWDKNGALYKVVFQGMSFKETQPIKGKLTADKNYGGQWQMVNDSVLLTYKGTADGLIDVVVKASEHIEPLKVEGRQIVFKLSTPPAPPTPPITTTPTQPQPAIVKDAIKEEPAAKPL
jgi:hypothetical protein